ncbi:MULTISPECIES: hypothetical protein [Eubacteriales]|uniref:hypothetical protein n=1 Tax=Eubacteriales TaxID=186802 RepID=UPI00051BA3C8|nr:MULTISPECIES: hypothetical protein [Eubacteriales]
MAAGRASSRRTNTYRRSGADSRSMYVYGNAVPKPDYEPQRRGEPSRELRRGKSSRQSRRVRQNQRRELRVGKRYVIFLSVAAVLALFICVNYVRLQSEIAGRSSNITALQEELADMREANNTKYNSIVDSVNMDQIKQKAEGELGMVPAQSGQIVEYDSPEGDYVTQYEQIPESGIIASADNVQD